MELAKLSPALVMSAILYIIWKADAPAGAALFVCALLLIYCFVMLSGLVRET